MPLSRRLGPQAVQKLVLAAVVIFVLILCGAVGLPAAAEGLADQAHSLKAAPADAAFYTANLRLREQFAIFLESKAYRRLMEIPIVQMGKGQVMIQWQYSPVPQIAQLRKFFDSAEGQEVLALLKEMHSDEIFFYGGQDVAGLLQLVMELNGLNRTAQIESMASGEERSAVMARQLMELLEEHAEEFQVPDMVFGYRIKNADQAKKHLERLQEVLTEQLEEYQPDLVERLEREQIAGNDFLTLRLDGTLIPWEALRVEAEDMDDEQFGQWEELLSDKTLVVAVGVVGEFVVVSIGDSTEPVETFGSGPSLAEQPAMTRLAKHAGERVTSIVYMSEALGKSLNSPQQTIDDLVGVADGALQEMEVDEEARDQLVEDIRGFGEDLMKYLPEPGELSAIGFLTERGYESFQYQTGTRPMEDSSEPLSVLEHVGGSPAMFLANRTKQSVEDYDLTVSWFKRIAAQAEQIAKGQAEPDDWDRYMELREKGLPLLERLDKANREQLMPALADGQQTLVIDTAAESTRWFDQMPESPEPLPMLEIGFAAKVSDAELLRQGVEEYFDVIQEAITLLHEINPDDSPDFEIPEPEVEELGDEGTMYVYSLPAEWGVDEQIAPNGAITKSTAAVGLTPAITERLLQTKSLAIDSSLDLNRPASMVTYVEFAKFIDAIRPWVDYGGGVAMGQIKMEDEEAEEGSDEEADEAPSDVQQATMMTAGIVMPQIHQFLDVMATMRSFSSVIYREDDAWVTHSEMHFEDLE